MTVYADVLFAVNYLVNLLLLLLCGKILGAVTSRKRFCLAALAGAAGSLMIFLPFYGFWIQTLLKLSLSFAMTGIAFRFRPWKKCLRALFVFFTVSFLFAGLMVALEFFVSPAGVLFYNGVVYFDISALQLVVWSGVAYLLLNLFERLFFTRMGEKQLYDLTIFRNGRSILVKVLSDNGNALKEPFSGAPVIVCSVSLIEKLLPQEAEGVRLIPCSTVAGAGVLTAFRPDVVVISGNGKRIETSDVYIAASRQPIEGEYQAVMNPQLVARTERNL